ncbi:MAG: hypothetical protein F4226_09720, partial [Synechococcus sp. SB0678_bin_12]|nr:hypothetical protein [Synechococcus sp. SB0678_bin_12]
MTKSGKVRINQLSRDLGLPAWQVVFDAAEKLSIPAKSHSSSINGEQAETIIGHLVAEGHLSEDLASAYKTRAVQKEKTVGSDKPGQAQPAPKQAKPTSKASTARLKAKPAVTARPTPAQASPPRKPAPKPSPANQRLHRKPSQPVKEPAPGPVRLANTPTTKKDPQHPSVVKVKTKAADHPAKGKTADKEGAAVKAGLTLVKPPSGEPKVFQKPRLVRPTAPKKPAEVPPTAASEKAPKAKAGSARGKSPSGEPKVFQKPRLVRPTAP